MTAGRGPTDQVGAWGEAEGFQLILSNDQTRRGSIILLGSIARGDDAAINGFELAQGFKRCVGADTFVGCKV